MREPVSDTHPEAERVQLELLRGRSPAERFALTRSLSTSAIQMARRALEKANPGLSKRELDLLFVESHYGSEIANRLRAFNPG